jgi:ammonia channel protein AmtB
VIDIAAVSCFCLGAGFLVVGWFQRQSDNERARRQVPLTFLTGAIAIAFGILLLVDDALR